MSYILEALKKSDQERNRGTTPGLQTVHTPAVQDARKRHWWIYLLVFALFMNAGLLLWWLQPWKSLNSKMDHLAAQQQMAPAENQTSKPAANNKAAVTSPLDNQAVLSQPSAAAKKEQQKLALQTQTAVAPWRDDKSPSAVKDQPPVAVQNGSANKADAPAGSAKLAARKSETPATQAPKPSQPVQTTPSVAPKAAAPQRDTKSVDHSKEKQTEPSKSVQEKAVSKTARANAAPAERLAELHAKALDEALTSKRNPTQPDITPPDTAAQKDQLPGLRNLPINIRQEIPELTLSFLVYADKPAERMVNINGQMMREGQEVAPGLKIEEITPEGAVFSYKGLRFIKGVL